MNYTTKKALLLSCLSTGSLLSSKIQIQLSFRNFHWNVINCQVKTACKPPPIKTALSTKSFGQPTHYTHPHRMQKGEIVPGIQLEEFKSRRHRLIESLKTFCCQHGFENKTLLAVIPSSYKKYMTEKIPYVFRQNSDFLYLTGCLEPDSALVLIAQENHCECVIFVRGRDAHSELWDGPRTGVDQAVELFGVDKSMPVNEFESFLKYFLKGNKDCMLWYDYITDIHPDFHRLMQQFLSQSWNKIWESPKPFIHQLRLYKSPSEQELMKKACEISSQAIKNAMKNSKPLDNESFIQARVDFECRMKGAEYLAYPPVVASGNRANIIHYINNDQVVEDGDLVLMDAGCEYHGYCGDITRTWPINGKFTPVQRTLYEVVYSVQTELVQMCSKFPSLDHLYRSMGNLLGSRLKDAGIMSSKVTQEDLNKSVFSFCPHHVSHYLGMDVHDTSSVPRHIKLEPGMIITVEPGVYVSSSNKYANPEYHGIGVRIEDDILMTNSGPLVLSSSCPKHPDDIEKLWVS